MIPQDRTPRSLSRRGLFAVGGAVMATTALGAKSAGAHGSGDTEQLYVPVKLVEALSRDTAVVELLDTGERILLYSAAGAPMTDDGATITGGLGDYEAGELLLVAAASEPIAIEEAGAAISMDPIFDLRRALEAQFMTTIVIGGAVDVNHEVDEVDGLVDRATALIQSR
ncbi:MAG TPA: hypothetical protein VF529_13725 [Solirubrobacteraceae bacterium]|jgi:hypothetical protein